MRKLIFVLCAVASLCAADIAAARTSRSGSSSGHSRSGHTAGRSFSKTCKTRACYKKHPNGHYLVTPDKKKKQ